MTAAVAHRALLALLVHTSFAAAAEEAPAGACLLQLPHRQAGPAAAARGTSLLQAVRSMCHTGSKGRAGARLAGLKAAYGHLGALLDRHKALQGRRLHGASASARQAHGSIGAALKELRQKSEALMSIVTTGDCGTL